MPLSRNEALLATKLAATPSRVKVALVSIPDGFEVIVYAGSMNEQQIVESIAGDFQCLDEKFPKTLAQLNACVDGFTVALVTQEVLTG